MQVYKNNGSGIIRVQGYMSSANAYHNDISSGQTSL